MRTTTVLRHGIPTLTARYESARRLTTLWIVAGVASLATGCGGGADDEASAAGSTARRRSSTPPASADSAPGDDRQVAQVVSLLTEPPATAGSLAKAEFYDDRRALLESIGPDEAELGLRVIAYLKTRPTEPQLTLQALVELVARTESLEAVDYLSDLVAEYGASLAIRATAAEHLWRTSPERAIDVLEPLLRERPRATTPPGEALLKGWLSAKDALGEEPSEVLALVATDLYREDAVRHAAIKAFEEPTPRAKAALEAILVESTGNFYLRRLAAQRIMKIFEREEACALVERVLSLEADMNMQIFMADLFTINCP